MRVRTGVPLTARELRTPALVADGAALQRNIAEMAAALPGSRLRPHVKAHKCTTLARRQHDAGHRSFTCATLREVEGMARAGLGEDLLLANETLDVAHLAAALATGARVTVAIDSRATLDVATAAGVREVVIDVNVGLPRCGCSVGDAGPLAADARAAGLGVRGVMGYEGHLMALERGDDKSAHVASSMALLAAAHEGVGGELISAGGTGSYDLNLVANEIQAGSYVLMDTSYAAQGLPFEQALAVLGTVVSISDGWAVADVGLKALGMDHGNPAIEGAEVWFCSDEHVTFAPGPGGVTVGDRVRVLPAHIDPTMAMHERLHILDQEDVVDSWEIDLRGW